jgi:hypothetical protein
MLLSLCMLIVFSLRRESLELILVDEPLPEVVLSHLFGSTPAYEHLRVFGCSCYPNTAATAPHKLAPRSSRCVFLGCSNDHKGYRCLHFSINRLIVSQHVIFDENSLPLATSPSPTGLDFLCESGSTVTTTGTSTPAPCRTAPEIAPGFESPMAPLPAPAVPLGFLPRAATTAAPRATPTAAPHAVSTAPIAAPCAASAASTAVTDDPPPRTWPDSPVAYIRRPQQPEPQAPHYHPLFGTLPWEVRVCWCLSSPRRIHIG